MHYDVVALQMGLKTSGHDANLTRLHELSSLLLRNNLVLSLETIPGNGAEKACDLCFGVGSLSVFAVFMTVHVCLPTCV